MGTRLPTLGPNIRACRRPSRYRPRGVSFGPGPCWRWCGAHGDRAGLREAGPGELGVEQGAEIARGRTVLRRLVGGSRYEALRVWDDALFAIMLAKVLRPDQVTTSAP